MTEPTTTQHSPVIPAQPGPREPAGAAVAVPKEGTVPSREGDSEPAGGGDGQERGAAISGPVIPGAGPAGVRPGERATLRLRETDPGEPPRYAPEWLQLREP